MKTSIRTGMVALLLAGMVADAHARIKLTTLPERETVRVDIQILERYQIAENSSLQLATKGIFGDAYLSFSAPAEEGTGFLPQDGSAAVVVEPTFFDKATKQLETISEGLAEVLGDDNRQNMSVLIRAIRIPR